MHCSHCGKSAAGNFCSHCGSPLAAPELTIVEEIQWETDVRYDALLRVPDVRSAIDRHARFARKKLTGEQFLALCDKIIPLGFPLETVVSIVMPLYEKLGIATGKQCATVINAPVGRVIVRVLCSLARHNQVIRNVQQASDGCLIEAALPSDVWSFEGDLLVTIRRRQMRTEVSAATKVKGQLFDWGKSRRCLDVLVADLHAEAA